MRHYGFQFGNEDFFVLARKSRGCAEAYVGTPHKQARRLTPPGRKRTVSGWKPVRSKVMADYRLRRSLLYVPGNMPSMLQNIPLFNCDGVIIDLEDAVPLSEKDAARILVKRFLENFTERNKEVLVRINPLDSKWGFDDLKMVLPALPDGVRLPKADTPEIVERLDTLLTEFEEELEVEIGRFRILPSIES